MTVPIPTLRGVIKVEAIPLASVKIVQFVPPAHAENPTEGEVNCALAPATGVTPSAATARTTNGNAAWPPTVAVWLAPETISI